MRWIKVGDVFVNLEHAYEVGRIERTWGKETRKDAVRVCYAVESEEGGPVYSDFHGEEAEALWCYMGNGAPPDVRDVVSWFRGPDERVAPTEGE